MMMTVATYAETRGRSESTVKAWIKKLNLELPVNPDDRRQRLISNQNQDLLDAHGKVKPLAPISTVSAVVEVAPYHRSEEMSLIIAEGTILEAQLNTYQAPQENQLLQAIRARTAEMEATNKLRYQQAIQSIHSNQDTSTIIANARRMQIVEAAQREAVEQFQMTQQIKKQTLDELNLLTLGIPPVNQQPAPTPQPRPQSQPSSPQPSWL